MTRPYETEFESAIEFAPDDLPFDDFKLAKRGDAYRNVRVEMAYQGYALARQAEEQVLERFSPDRAIGAGQLAELRARLGHDISIESIRTVLELIAEWPP